MMQNFWIERFNGRCLDLSEMLETLYTAYKKGDLNDSDCEAYCHLYEAGIMSATECKAVIEKDLAYLDIAKATKGELISLYGLPKEALGG